MLPGEPSWERAQAVRMTVSVLSEQTQPASGRARNCAKGHVRAGLITLCACAVLHNHRRMSGFRQFTIYGN